MSVFQENVFLCPFTFHLCTVTHSRPLNASRSLTFAPAVSFFHQCEGHTVELQLGSGEDRRHELGDGGGGSPAERHAHPAVPVVVHDLRWQQQPVRAKTHCSLSDTDFYLVEEGSICFGPNKAK